MLCVCAYVCRALHSGAVCVLRLCWHCTRVLCVRVCARCGMFFTSLAVCVLPALESMPAALIVFVSVRAVCLFVTVCVRACCFFVCVSMRAGGKCMCACAACVCVRVHAQVGMYLGLSGGTLTGEQVYWAGVADYYSTTGASARRLVYQQGML
jgi:hypothetical protein